MALRAVVLALLVTFIAPAAQAQERVESGWSERGVFLFADYVFDFWYGRAGIAGAHATSRLEDCSNDEFYCLHSQYFSVVLPRVCRALNVGDSWTVGAVTTRVVAQVTHPGGPHHTPLYEHAAYALASDVNNTVYLYDPPYGVTSIYPGFDPATNARAVAESGRLMSADNGLSALPLTSPDSFGPCRER